MPPQAVRTSEWLGTRVGRGSELEMERERQSCEYTRSLARSVSEGAEEEEEEEEGAETDGRLAARLTYGSALPMPTAAAPSLPLSYSTPRNFHFVTLSTLKFIAIRERERERENKGEKVPSERALQNFWDGWLRSAKTGSQGELSIDVANAKHSTTRR